MTDLTRQRPPRAPAPAQNPPQPPATQGVAAPTRSRPAAAAVAGSGLTGAVRRNLFQSQLTRRPTHTSSAAGTTTATATTTTTSSSNGSSSAETLRLDGCVDVLSDSEEIVVRDRHGEIELGDEPTHGLEDGEEEEALDERQENERERERLASAARERIMMSQEDRQRLGDAVTRTMKQGMVSEDHEDDHLDAVKASLRAKVAALDEDSWMFSPDSHVHR